jgi:hypothetical protein
MTSEWEKWLKDVAREATKAAQCSGEDCWGQVNAVLKQRLLPLLEAGQAMRDGTSPLRIQVGARWDAAKQQAEEGL